MKSTEIDFRKVPAGTVRAAVAAGVLSSHDERFAEFGRLQGTPVRQKVVRMFGTHLMDGTVAQQIKDLEKLRVREGFVGGLDDIYISSGYEYDQGSNTLVTRISGWVEITEKQEQVFKSFVKRVQEETAARDEADAARLRERAAALRAEADRLEASANVKV